MLHSKNVMHRDLKPQNLLLSEDSLQATLKIADFGFAREIEEASMAETMCGTPLYMVSPVFVFLVLCGTVFWNELPTRLLLVW